MQIDIRQLQHVAAIGRFRSFNRAAESLGISQPSLSKSLRAVEAGVGVRLFERSRAGVTPTVYGEAILAGSGAAIRAVDEVLREIRRLRGLEGEALRVGAGPFALELSVSDAAFQVTRGHPTLQLAVTLGGWEQLTREVMSGGLDIAVAELATAEQDDRLLTERLGTHSGVFYVRADHPLLQRPRLALADIGEFPLALPPMPGRVAPFFEAFPAAGRFDPATGHFVPALALDSLALMKRAVSETNSVSWAPEVLLAAELAAGSLAALPVRPAWGRLNYGVIRRKDRPMTPAMESFLSALREIEALLPRTPATRRRGSRRRAARARASGDSPGALAR